MSDVQPLLVDDDIELPGLRMAVRRAPGPLRPFLLVHGLASNARLWDGVARRLAAAGHEVVAVDQRGHGLSEEPASGYDTATAASDLAELIAVRGWTGDRAPVVAGQSWGGNVALTLAAVHGSVAAVALVDGGWIHLADRFPTFDECWAQLEPPVFADWPAEGRAAMLANFADLPDGTVRPHLSREHHRSIVHSLWLDDPRPLYARVTAPALLMPAVDEVPTSSIPVTVALELLPDADVRWYVGAHHDLHAQLPDRCAADLLDLAARVDG